MSVAKPKVPVFDRRAKEVRDYWVGSLSPDRGASGPRPDHWRPASGDGLRCTLELTVPRDLSSRLARLTGGSPFLSYTALLAVLALCLHKYNGHETVVVGSPPRHKEGEAEPPPNALAIVTRVGGRLTFKEFLKRVRETLIEAYANQNYPYERLLRDLGHGVVENRCPLFDVALVFEGIHGELREVHNDITLHFRQSGELFSGSVVYNAGIFEEETVARFAGHMLTLLHSALEDLNEPLDGLSILSEEERRLLLVEWAGTTAERVTPRCLHELFTEQAHLRSDEAAILFGEERVNYGELDEESNRLANHLLRRGLRPGSRVGLMVERSPRMLTGLLAVLKAGCAYVPLDPQYPTRRLRFMLEDSAPSFVLTTEELRERLGDYACEVVSLDSAADEIAHEGTEPPGVAVWPETAAYIIYTSGSTGRPKGVVVSHKGISNLARAQAEMFGVNPNDRVLQFASLSFDASVAEIVMALAHGATLCLAKRESLIPGPDFVRLLKEHAVNIVTLPPSALAAMPDAELPDLRVITVAGESCPAEVVERWAEGRHFFNLYGPTEDTIWTTAARCDVGEGKPSIGRPIAGRRVYLLDARLEPVPVGVPGELCIAGIGLAHGYLNRTDLTAERFVPDPFSSEMGARLYRTGDLARYLADGEIEFLGRIDQQVKIRGHRIELGEVESALAEHPAVRETAVLLAEDGRGDGRLVAYLVANDREPLPGGDELREHLRQWLPDYMAPAQFIWLDEMPLNPNGKVDRKRLPPPAEAGTRAASSAYVAPRTTTEELLAALWADVLKVERVGVEDNFFELGGHSLLGTQLISRIRETFGVEVALGSLFETPTVAALARLVEEAGAGDAGVQLPPVVRASRAGELPLSFAQQRLWFLAQLEPDSAAYNISTALRLEGRLDVEALGRAIDEIVRRHESLRTTFEAGPDGKPVQVVNSTQTLRLCPEDLAGLHEAQRRATEEAHTPFDLERGPLFRVRLLRLGDSEHVMLFTAHHIISDGWSMGVLVKEVAALYDSYTRGLPSPLEELSIQYADYAAWQRDWLQGEELRRQLSHWRERLSGVPPLELPADRPRPPIHTHRGARCAQALSAELTKSVEELARREGATLFMVLMAAFQALLSRYSTQEDFAVGTPVANRRRSELEGLIGFFVNTLVIRADISADPTFVELLARVRSACLGAYAHQDVPFERLVEELQPERDLGRSPLFQAMLVLQNAPMESLGLHGLTLSAVGIEQQTAKFDLTLAAERAGEQLFITLEYNTDLFEPATVERMLEHFVVLLAAATDAPSLSLSRLPLMGERELGRLLGEWAGTTAERVTPRCLHELFTEQAQLRSDEAAILFGEERVNYGELDEESNRLANHLLRRGLRPGSRVGLMVERSPRMLTGLLAVLKAGCAFVPLDPYYPAERLRFMLEDSAPSFVLTQESLRTQLDDYTGYVLSLDSGWAEVEAERAEVTRVAVWPETAAYVIYTSGSTGRPKGVVVSHAGVANLARAQAELFGVNPSDRVLQFASLSFDASVFELVMALTHGATLCLAGRKSLIPGPDFVRLLKEHAINIVTLPPSALAAMPDAELPDLRVITVAGESCPTEVVERWAAGRRFFNLYGPTEDTIWTTAAEYIDGARKPSIGRPIAGRRVYLLDVRLEPVPVGVPGELCIAGIGLAHGYLNRADLTAERFVPDPFSSEIGARLYRTGDLARYLADGEIEFLGRIDQQVKIRGFRIEPGEIEAALGEHPGVREAAVIVREDRPGDRRLVAYVVAREAGAGADAATLREYLHKRLPAYMVPHAFVTLDALPLSPNGKLDRRALPPPVQADAATFDYVAPRSEVEQAIAAIWAELLGVERVGAEDNFFELGGHSLLLAQVHAKLSPLFPRELSVIDLFKYPTVSALAEHIGRGAIESSTPVEGRQRGQSRLELLKRRAEMQRGQATLPAAQGAHDEQQQF